MDGCFASLALLAAVVALFVAVFAMKRARLASEKVSALETELLRARFGTIEQPAAPEPHVAPMAPTMTEMAAPPARPEERPAPPVEETIPRYVPPAGVARAWSIDWENLVGIRLFGAIAGIALVLAAIYLFRYSVEHGWLRPAVRAAFGLITGIGLLVVCELRVSRDYRATANAMDGAGIAILYATLYALHARWQLWPATAVFAGMLLVTAAAVFLSTRRDSVFIALLGLFGGFATPALLSSGENKPIELFSYLLLLNGGISWVAWRKRWPVLTALSVALTAIYQWAWISRFLTRGQLPLAAGIFVAFAVVAASTLWPAAENDPRQGVFRRIAAAGAVLPLLFAFFTAIVPEYGSQFHVLFGFLLLVTAGLALVATTRGPEWLHLLGGGATLLTFFIWLAVSYTHAAWPWVVVWLAAFVALYLTADLRRPSIAVHTSGLLFFVFVGFATREPAHAATVIGAMFALLVVVAVFAAMRRNLAVIAIALVLSIVALIAATHAAFALRIVASALLFAALLAVAALGRKHWIAVAAVVLMAAATISAAPLLTSGQELAFAAVLYALFIAYALVAGTKGDSLAPHLAAALASAVFFGAAYDPCRDLGLKDVIGLLPLSLAVVLVLLLWRHLVLVRRIELPDRLAARTIPALIAGAALAFITAAIPLQLENEWVTVAWALEGAALAWLFRRIPHGGLLVWSGGLFAAVFVRLAMNPAVFAYHAKTTTPVLNWYLYAYLVSAAAMFVGARFFPREPVQARGGLVAGGTAILFVLLNIEIADFYSAGSSLTFNFFSSSLAQDLTYTIGWAVFALAMLIAGIALHSRTARIAALCLLLVTILKCFLHDLARLGGLYRVGSLFGLAVSLVLVGILLQRFVILRPRES